MKKTAFIIVCLFIALKGFSQADFEIQVYSSPITQKDVTFLELHSNYTINGIKDLPNPSSARYLNESIEITHGFGHNFELGFYIFNSFSPDGKYVYRGSHIRPRYTAPDSWHLPIGISLSIELGFIKPYEDSVFNWDGEIRPIFDKNYGNFYVSFNPNMDFMLTGDDQHFGLTPQLKSVYTINGKMGVGFEYYTALGTFKKLSPIKEQEHILGPMIDLYCWKNWEFNCGLLFGLTPNSNQTILKLLLGRRYSKGK